MSGETREGRAIIDRVVERCVRGGMPEGAARKRATETRRRLEGDANAQKRPQPPPRDE